MTISLQCGVFYQGHSINFELHYDKIEWHCHCTVGTQGQWQCHDCHVGLSQSITVHVLHVPWQLNLVTVTCITCTWHCITSLYMYLHVIYSTCTCTCTCNNNNYMYMYYMYMYMTLYMTLYKNYCYNNCYNDIQ
jgi:hypothetical protein